MLLGAWPVKEIREAPVAKQGSIHIVDVGKVFWCGDGITQGGDGNEKYTYLVTAHSDGIRIIILSVAKKRGHSDV